jgi:hypothetical protein
LLGITDLAWPMSGSYSLFPRIETLEIGRAYLLSPLAPRIVERFALVAGNIGRTAFTEVGREVSRRWTFRHWCRRHRRRAPQSQPSLTGLFLESQEQALVFDIWWISADSSITQPD